MRKQIVAGNWKMNNNQKETKQLIKDIKKGIKTLKLKETRVLIAPTYINLAIAKNKTKGSKIEVISQNMHQAKNGAYTGEISANMLKSLKIKTVILGHSERRTHFGETDVILKEKANAALENKLEIIFCFGELLEDRKNDNHFKIVENQLKNALFHLETKAWKKIILAYEPVWAIGTGETASPKQAQEMHAFIRNLVKEKYDNKIAENTSILYGGSVKPSNAKEIFKNKDVDGGLIGGAALNAENFVNLIQSF